MQSDDLGQFPLPSKPQTPPEPANPPQISDANPAVQDNALMYHDPFSTSTTDTVNIEDTQLPQSTPPFQDLPEEPIISTDTFIDLSKQETPVISDAETFDLPNPSIDQTPEEKMPEVPGFEETPEEIPFVQPPTPEITPPEPFLNDSNLPPTIPPSVEQEVTTSSSLPPVTQEPIAQPQEVIATLPPKNSNSIAPFVFIGLLFVAGIGLAVSVFLFSQSSELKKQLTDITQTLEKQETTITPTPTAPIVEVSTPSATPTPTLVESTISGSLTPTMTPTPILLKSATPLSYAQQALKVAINREPNAQMILIKSENASDPANSITKYFFRQDLKTKKYFYVTILDKGEPAIIDKAIYVTPDNDIPSLNEAILTNSFGVDLDKALSIAYTACTSGLCETANLKAQFIKSNDNYVWQLSFTPKDTTKDALIIQINSKTQEILYKSSGF